MVRRYNDAPLIEVVAREVEHLQALERGDVRRQAREAVVVQRERAQVRERMFTRTPSSTSISRGFCSALDTPTRAVQVLLPGPGERRIHVFTTGVQASPRAKFARQREHARKMCNVVHRHFEGLKIKRYYGI